MGKLTTTGRLCSLRSWNSENGENSYHTTKASKTFMMSLLQMSTF